MFHAVASELLSGDEVIAEGAKRWNEESFFKEGKHQFGLAQFALRTAQGPDRWVLLVFVTWTLAILHRTPEMTLEVAAFTALITVLPFIHLNVLLRTFSINAEFLRQYGYSLTYARCNF
ncbi:hypothetical protein GCM10022631_07790 [Deinococcus rubellus]